VREARRLDEPAGLGDGDAFGESRRAHLVRGVLCRNHPRTVRRSDGAFPARRDSPRRLCQY
jgi:hypothetical protein